MVDILTLMKDKNQEKFAFVEPIREAMKARGWKAVDLSRASGVNEAAISRLLKGGRSLSAANLYAMMIALEFVGPPSQQTTVDNSTLMGVPSPASFKQKNIPVLQEVETVLNSDDTDAINALKTGVRGLLLMLKEKTEGVTLLREIAAGQKEGNNLIRELSTVIAETSVPAVTDRPKEVRKKKAV